MAAARHRRSRGRRPRGHPERVEEPAGDDDSVDEDYPHPSDYFGPRQEAEYSALDRAYLREAPWVPLGSLSISTFVSSAIDLDKVIVSPIFGQDPTSFEGDR